MLLTNQRIKLQKRDLSEQKNFQNGLIKKKTKKNFLAEPEQTQEEKKQEIEDMLKKLRA